MKKFQDFSGFRATFRAGRTTGLPEPVKFTSQTRCSGRNNRFSALTLGALPVNDFIKVSYFLTGAQEMKQFHRR
jgi:hypothetical protein